MIFAMSTGPFCGGALRICPRIRSRTSAARILNHVVEYLFYLAKIRWLGAHPTQRSVSPHNGGDNRLADFMGYRSCQLAHRRDTVSVRQLHLDIAITLFALTSVFLRLGICSMSGPHKDSALLSPH